MKIKNMSTKPTPKERKERTSKLKELHQPFFDSISKPNAIFIPKMAHNVKGLEGLHMGFFKSEIDHGEDVYTEMVSMSQESEDETRTLYKARFNPHFEEEYAKSDPMPNGHCRYFIPVDELEAVNKEIEVEDDFVITQDPDSGDVPMDQMTLRDYAAIKLLVPSSSKDWLNSMIEEAINKPF